MGLIKSFLWGVFIFVVGSLVLSWIINGNIFIKVYDKIVNIKDDIKTNSIEKQVPIVNSSHSQSPEVIKFIPSQDKSFGALGYYYSSCTSLEMGAEASGVYNIKQKACTQVCGVKKMNFYASDCEYDILACYCIN